MRKSTSPETKMQPPTLVWTGYNLFRLVAVVFMSWALVAQLIAIANELDAYSNAPDAVPTSSPVPIGEARASNTSSSASRPSTSSAMDSLSVEPTAQAVFQSSTFASSSGAHRLISSTTSRSIAISTPTSLAASFTSSSHGGVVILDPLGGTETLANFAGISSPADSSITQGTAARALQVLRRTVDDESAQTATVGYVGASSVPDQPGGVFFLLVSRIMMAIVLGGLILVQVGYPETWLYKHLAWLGPQSTPLSLAGVQLVIAVENLHVYGKQSLLIPAWGLLAIGLANVLIAGLLLYLKRKQPNPNRYFLSISLSTRTLYWTPPPPFYRHLTERNTLGSEFSATQHADEIEDSEKGGRPSHDTAYDLGDSDEDDDGTVVMDPVPPIARKHLRRPAEMSQTQRTRELGVLREEQDVRRGGYPTFARGEIDQPGRHVPAGVLEQRADGEVVRYIAEDGQAATRPVGRETREHYEETGPTKHAKPSDDTRRHTMLRQPPSRKRTMEGVRNHGNGTAELSGARSGAIDERGVKSEIAVVAPRTEETRRQDSTISGRQQQSLHPSAAPIRLASKPPVQLPLPPKTRKRTTDLPTPIQERGDDQNTTTSTPAQLMTAQQAEPIYDEPEAIERARPTTSLSAAASDLGPLFPLPPDRPELAIEAASSAKANRQGSGDSVRRAGPAKELPTLPLPAESRSGQHSGLRPALHHRELLDVPKTPTPPLGDGTLEVKQTRSIGSSPLREAPTQALPGPKSDRTSRQSTVAPQDDYFSAVIPRMALSSTTQDTTRPNGASEPQLSPAQQLARSFKDEQGSRTSYQISARRPQQLGLLLKRDSPQLRPGSSLSRLRFSMAISRSPSSRSIRSNRTAQGVRFDLSPISVTSGGSQSAPNSPTRSLSPLSPPPKIGLRIPGTRLTVNLPRSSVPGTPRPPARESLTSEEDDEESAGEWSEEETARPESVLSGRTANSGESAAVGDGRRLSPKRSNTIDTLGGQYLDGGKAPRHSRHSSIDSFA